MTHISEDSSSKTALHCAQSTGDQKSSESCCQGHVSPASVEALRKSDGSAVADPLVISAGMRPGQKAWAAGGFLCFVLGALGAVIPLLPTVPFLLGAACCFARSSARLEAWFQSTKLYRNVLEGYVAGRGMTVRAKISLLVPTTLVLGVSFALMENVLAGRVIVAAIWIAHLIYFGFIVRTVDINEPNWVPETEGGR